MKLGKTALRPINYDVLLTAPETRWQRAQREHRERFYQRFEMRQRLIILHGWGLLDSKTYTETLGEMNRGIFDRAAQLTGVPYEEAEAPADAGAPGS